MARILIGALILSLVIWVAFYYLGWPLMKSETAIVTGFCLLVMSMANWLLRRFRGRKNKSKTGRARSTDAKRSHIVKCLAIVLLTGTEARSATSEMPLCAIDRPTAAPSDQLRLSVLRAPGESETVHYRWSVPTGRMEGDGPDISWILSSAPVGRYVATLTITQPNGEQAECSVRLFVVSANRGATGRGLLIRGKQVLPGYGLYTYLLFSSPPEKNSHDRYIQAIATYLRLSPSLEQLEDVIDRRDINLNYVPVDSSPLGDVDAEWVLRHYDYARAKALLSVIGGNHFSGPYLLSGSHTTNDQTLLSEPLLFQDLSYVPSHLIAAWYEQFLSQAAQQDFSAVASAEKLALRVRTLVAVLAIGLPDVKTEIGKWVEFTR